MSIDRALRTLDREELAWAMADAWSIPQPTVTADPDLIALGALIQREQLAGFTEQGITDRLGGFLDHAVILAYEPGDPRLEVEWKRRSWESYRLQAVEELCSTLVVYREEDRP